MNIQLIVNGVNLVEALQVIADDQTNVTRFCNILKDAFPKIVIHRQHTLISIEYSHQAIFAAVLVPGDTKIFVYNCVERSVPEMVEVQTLAEAWVQLCEHLLQTQLTKLFDTTALHIRDTLRT